MGSGLLRGQEGGDEGMGDISALSARHRAAAPPVRPAPRAARRGGRACDDPALPPPEDPPFFDRAPDARAPKAAIRPTAG